MYLKIKKITREPDKYGHRLTITMIGLYDDAGRWIRWVKLNDKIIDILSKCEIPVNVNDHEA